jgi:hypothetical protein
MANTAAYSGLRWGELASLAIQQVDQAARAITVDRKVVEVAGLNPLGAGLPLADGEALADSNFQRNVLKRAAGRLKPSCLHGHGALRAASLNLGWSRSRSHSQVPEQWRPAGEGRQLGAFKAGQLLRVDGRFSRWRSRMSKPGAPCLHGIPAGQVAAETTGWRPGGLLRG